MRSPGGPVDLQLISFSFSWQTPNLAAGVPIFVPSIGQLLYDAWFEPVQAWAAAAPIADCGQGLAGTAGLFGGVTQSMPDTTKTGPPQGQPGLRQAGAGFSVVPFTSVSPLLVWASDTGAKGAALAAKTAGLSVFRALILTPNQ